MSVVETKGRRDRRSLTAAYKAAVVALSSQPGSSIAKVARDLDLTETAVQQAEVDRGERKGLTTTEREELSHLHRENRILREERDVLKRAMAFFAMETR
jgi:transposase